MIVVIRPGFLDLVMDLGRPGFRMQGVPEGGAADVLSLIRANRLVGNPDHAAGLELTLKGPHLLFPEGAIIALTGADMEIQLQDRLLEPNAKHKLEAGAVLKLGASKRGARAYLAVAGGIDVPMVLGSRATFLPGGWGGWQGRALKADDRLPIGKMVGQPSECYISLPSCQTTAKLRVLPGPQLGGFSDTALVNLLHHTYRLSPDSNRVGIRLLGPPLAYLGDEIASQAVLPGVIQVPPSGQPIILGWDGPVTGGYPVIAGVIAADLPKLAQLRPGDKVAFQMVNGNEARQAWKEVITRVG